MEDHERLRRLAERQRETMEWARDKLQKLMAVGELDDRDRATVRAIWEALGPGNPRLRG